MKIPASRMVLLVTGFLALSPSAWGCRPVAEAQRSSSVSAIALPMRVEPAVVHLVGKFEMFVPADAMLRVLSQKYLGVRHDYDLAIALRSRMPLAGDIETNELVRLVVPVGLPRTRDLRYSANQKLMYALAELLELGQVALLHKGAPVATIERVEYVAECSGGRRFRTVDGEPVFAVLDWVS